MKPIEKLLTLKCGRCFHEWIPRHKRLPAHCPKCKSPYWNKPRVKKYRQKTLDFKVKAKGNKL